MHVFVLYCNTMLDHGTESRGHVLFRVTRGNTSGTCIETRFNLFQSVSSRTNNHYWYIVVSVCSSRHGWKQIKLVSMHVPVVRQHCAQIEGFAFNRITALGYSMPITEIMYSFSATLSMLLCNFLTNHWWTNGA